MLGKGAEILEINERLKLGSWEAGKLGSGEGDANAR